jgi:hypothetical protein
MTADFSATGKDQYNKEFLFTPEWSATGGTIDASGLYTAGDITGNYIVVAKSGNISDTANVTIEDGGLKIPGKFEAENYTAMSGVQTEPCSDIGGGLNIGYIDVNDWIDYTVNVAEAGNYMLNFRVASALTTGAFQVKNGATILAVAKVKPKLAGWQSWENLPVLVNLPQGTVTLRILATGAGFNLNYISSAKAVKVEAESYTAMKGIQTETTTDFGGGQNIGYTDATDYLDYSVNLPAGGLSTVYFRVASLVATGKIELRTQTGTLLASLAQGTTGGWQEWITVGVPANLNAGVNNLRVYYTGAGLNLNWFAIINGTLKSAEVENDLANMPVSNSFVYPNPVTNTLTIDLNGNTYSQVAVTDLLGRVQTEMQINSEEELSIDFNSYPKGIYIIRLSNGSKIEYLKVVKQ